MGSPFKQRFNLKRQLASDTFKKGMNMKPTTLDTPSMPTGMSEIYTITNPKKLSASEKFNKKTRNILPTGLADDFAMKLATGSDEGRLTDSQARAFEDYSNRLSDNKFFGERDQYGMRQQDVGDTASGIGLKGQSYARRDFNVPFTENGSDENFPVLSSYASNMPSQINPMYLGSNDPDYLNQQKRNQRRGVDFNQFAINQEGQGNNFGLMDQQNTFQNTIGFNSGDYKMPAYNRKDRKDSNSGINTDEEYAVNAMNASNIATESLQNAISSGNFENAQRILGTGFDKISGMFSNYRGKDKAYRGTIGGGDGSGSRSLSGGRGGDRTYLNNPGLFYGSRVKDNLEYRTNNASDLYTTDYLPNRSEEVDKEAYSKVQSLIFKNKMKSINNLTDKFDTRSGQII